RMARAAPGVASLAGAAVDLRGAPRLVAPGSRLPRPRRAARRPRRDARLHPRRAPPGHGAPVLGIVGIPGDGVLRTHVTFRRTRRLPRVRRRPPPPRPRRDPRLGPGALPPRRLGPRPL